MNFITILIFITWMKICLSYLIANFVNSGWILREQYGHYASHGRFYVIFYNVNLFDLIKNIVKDNKYGIQKVVPIYLCTVFES